ncbi:MAG: GAF domain-containing protein [Blastocatellia bacterium]|nr:GAF domain-containing protein [Blastocatellia bacterium]
MKRILILFILLASGAPVRAQYPGAEPLSVWEKSRQMQRDYVEHLKEKLASDPENLALKMDLGRAYHWLALEREEVALVEGEKLFAKIVEQDPRNAVALAYHSSFLGLKIGYGLVPQEEISGVGMRAFGQMDRAVGLAPDSIEVRQVRGYASFNAPSVAGRDRVAIEDFTHVIRLLEQRPDTEGGPGSWRRGEIYLVLGDAYRKIEDSANARASWERAAELLSGTSLRLVAEDRLRSQGQEDESAAINARVLTALFGFLIGAIIFAILTALILRDLLRLHKRRGGMVASLFVSMGAMFWNAMNLVPAVNNIIGDGQTAAAWQFIDWNRNALYLILSLSPIPFGLMIAYRFYKATFMDIVLKRGAALMAVFALSMVYARLVEYHTVMTTLRISVGTLRTIFFAGMWLWIYLLYPPLRDRIYALVDRYVFKRRDYSRLLDWFNDRLRAVTDEASLIAVTTDGLKEAFAADRVRFVSASDDLAIKVSAALADKKGDVVLRQRLADVELEAGLEKEGVELILAIRSGEELAGIILVGQRAYGQGYLSEELSVLRALTAQIGRTMENLRLHEARRKQALLEEEGSDNTFKQMTFYRSLAIITHHASRIIYPVSYRRG